MNWNRTVTALVPSIFIYSFALSQTWRDHMDDIDYNYLTAKAWTVIP